MSLSRWISAAAPVARALPGGRYGWPGLLFTGVLTALATWHIVAFLQIAYLQISARAFVSPFEDALLYGVHRLLAGQLVYVDASADYIPFIYNPGLYYAAALVSKLFGATAFVARLPAALATAALPFVLYAIFRRLSPDGADGARLKAALQSLFAFGLYATLFEPSAFPIVALKADALLALNIALCIWLLLRNYAAPRELGFDLVLLATASSALFFIKQTGLLLAILNTALLFVAGRPRAALVHGAVVGTITVALIVAFEAAADSRFMDFAWGVPASHQLAYNRANEYLLSFFYALPLAAAPALVLFALRYLRRLGSAMPPNFIHRIYAAGRSEIVGLTLIAYAVGNFAISYVGAAKMGGYPNSLLYAALCLAILALHALEAEDDLALKPAPFAWLAGALLLWQAGAQVYDRAGLVARHERLAAHEDEYLKALCALKQPTLNYQAAYLGALYCGARPQFSYMAAIDIVNHSGQLTRFRESFEANVRARRYASVVTALNYTPEQIAAYLDQLALALAAEKNPRKRREMENFRVTVELEGLLRSTYRVAPPEALSPAERRYLELEAERSGQPIFILHPTP